MLYVLRRDYDRFCSLINTRPYEFPPVSLKSELERYRARYLGWAIWCLKGLPAPRTNEEHASVQMLRDYLNKNLRIVDEFDETMRDADIW